MVLHHAAFEECYGSLDEVRPKPISWTLAQPSRPPASAAPEPHQLTPQLEPDAPPLRCSPNQRVLAQSACARPIS
eukprot:5253470-Prymnesium_polylepis.1